MATATPSSLQLQATDVIRKEHLDEGGFGEVYLCYHVRLGPVVMKTMYTGKLRNEDNKRSLLEEGNIMASLNHQRVVKLLGVIMEDRGCSLVMELMPRGNLLAMLETVTVPVSIKGRIILEILEGMVYLTEKKVIHKDIKPDNILIDKDFHIKIADLGLAACKTWRKLTKEESHKRSHLGLSNRTRAAGTLSYMAPEHLESVHAVSTEKSDVYSFAIVVWVIVTGKEPYANARNEDQISQCVRNGNRPAMNLIPDQTPEEISNLMVRCWAHNPLQRPTFLEAYHRFRPFYETNLAPHVEKDLVHLQALYEGPDQLVEKMKSLALTDECISTGGRFHRNMSDGPAFLESTDKSVNGPVEDSIEDSDALECETNVASLAATSEPDPEDSLEEKLQPELNYHIHGSYTQDSPSDFVAKPHRRSLPDSLSSFTNNTLRPPERDTPSSVHSWTKAQPVQPSSQDRTGYSCLQESMTTSMPKLSQIHTSASNNSLPPFNQQHPYYRLQSCPTSSVPETSWGASNYGAAQESGSLHISNARGIQIGNNNSLNIHFGNSDVSSFHPGHIWTSSQLKEGIQKYEDRAVTGEHLDVLRKNIGANWKFCARHLGLSEVEIETIEHDFHSDGLSEMVHQTLQHWKRTGGSLGCKIGKLCRALEGTVEASVIQKILHICASTPNI
ncbi:receptor-interacting serine/threonine-protein kinase 1 isoform X2 [Syngnathus typhle]|uniref:receptor-interacting serine/threonine-protein kinase 1 isoform X2 n=1 Tax=Syngnathus typhle TaxID=161592 RepID=UPI002A699675|nr:receptor-interacting serine/threonine-protein kinase 1 isoform X2 [Syngnathus typhle]